MSQEERVRAALKERHACCSSREVRAVLDLLAAERVAIAEECEARARGWALVAASPACDQPQPMVKPRELPEARQAEAEELARILRERGAA